MRVGNGLSWRGGFWDKALFSILLMAILGALGTVVYTITVPKVGEKFTEFYLLGLNGEASGYPTQLRVGEVGKVVVGIGNREHETATYRVEVRIDGVINNQAGPLTIKSDETWQEVVTFIPARAGDKQKVEFLLYKQGQSDVYQRLHLLLDVS